MLDLCVLFSDVWTAFATDAALASTSFPDLSTRSLLPPLRRTHSSHRRRKKSQRAEEEGELAELEAALRDEVESGEEGESIGPAGMTTDARSRANQTTIGSISFVDESFLSRIER
jgi:hypothetical protein